MSNGPWGSEADVLRKRVADLERRLAEAENMAKDTRLVPADALHECPFCGGELRMGQPGGGKVYVYCAECRLHIGGAKRTQAELAEFLNRRALPAEVREVLIGLLRGTDEYWETTTEGQEVLTRARAILDRYGEVGA